MENSVLIIHMQNVKSALRRLTDLSGFREMDHQHYCRANHTVVPHLLSKLAAIISIFVLV